MQLSDEEKQLIEVIREQTLSGAFRLLIEVKDGSWEVELSNDPAREAMVRGTGPTFDLAWSGIAPIGI